MGKLLNVKNDTVYKMEELRVFLRQAALSLAGKCAHCERSARFGCNGCKGVLYCGTDCQRSHWESHASICLVGAPGGKRKREPQEPPAGALPSAPRRERTQDEDVREIELKDLHPDIMETLGKFLGLRDMKSLMEFLRRMDVTEGGPQQVTVWRDMYKVLQYVFLHKFTLVVNPMSLENVGWIPNEIAGRARRVKSNITTTNQLRSLMTLFPRVKHLNLPEYNALIPPNVLPKKLHTLRLRLFNQPLADGFVFPAKMGGSLILPRFNSEFDLDVLPREIGGDVDLSSFNRELRIGVLPRKIGGSLYLSKFTRELVVGILPREIGINLDLGNFNLEIAAGTFPREINGYLNLRNFNRELAPNILPRRIGGNLILSEFDQELVSGVLPHEIDGYLDLSKFNKELVVGVLPRKIGGDLGLDSFNKELAPGVLPRKIGGDIGLNSFNKELAVGVLPPIILGRIMLNSFNKELAVGVFPKYSSGGIILSTFDKELAVGVLPRAIRGNLMLSSFNQNLVAGILPHTIDADFYFQSFNKELITGVLPRRINGRLYLKDFRGHFPPSKYKTIVYIWTRIELTDEMRRNGFRLPLR